MTKTCSVKDCQVEKADGDILFCTECRKRWIEVCNQYGLKEKPIKNKGDEAVVNTLLFNFQDGKEVN